MNYKRGLIAGIAVATLVTGGVLAATNDSPPVPTKAATIKAAVTATSTPHEVATTDSATPVQAEAPVTSTTQVDPTPTSEAPNYTVTDTTTVMSSANIPADQQAIADEIITHISGWHYKSDIREVNLCSIYPSVKMAPEGADYLDNPVTQLSWCNKYVTSRFGSWQGALDHLNATGSFL